MKVYGVRASRTFRALWMMEEVEADYEYIELDLKRGDLKGDAYRALNPLGKMPTLVDGQLVLFESGAILNYLAERFPDRKLIPPVGSAERPLYHQWCCFILTELEQGLWTAGKHTFVLPEAKRVPAMVQRGYEEFSEAAGTLAVALGDREYLVGDQFTAADILAAHTLNWASKWEVPLGHANLEIYLERLKQRPAFQRVLSKPGIPFRDTLAASAQ